LIQELRDAAQFLKTRAAREARDTVRDKWDKQSGFGISTDLGREFSLGVENFL
jgi:hypothetical protein